MNSKTLSFITKLKRLQAQIRSAILADYAYEDAKTALEMLDVRVRSSLLRVEQSENLSSGIRNAILRDANFLIIRATYIVGVIVRSTSIRNAFELYVPFLQICRLLLGDEAKLVLSSEWQYIPFTHPQNLSELPAFVIIGMPASESDNALVFPAAGHELGHSVWLKHGIGDELKEQITREIDRIFIDKRTEIEEVFAEVRGADLDQDMFAQYIKSSVYHFSTAQIEELFSDFVGLLLFGESYLYAFEFLISPQLSGARTGEYPDTLSRAKILEDYASNRLSLKIDRYSSNFLSDQGPSVRQQALLFNLSDAITEKLLPTVFERADKLIRAAGIPLPTTLRTSRVEEAFRSGVPFDGEASVGDIINAAWRIFRSPGEADFGERRLEETLTDLVMKSVELDELRNYLP